MEGVVLPRLLITDSVEVKEEIKQLRDQVIASYGPDGRIPVLQPLSGGHVTLTCQSSQFFQLYKSSIPLVQLLCSCLQSHATNHDGGKFTAILCTNLILNSLESYLPRRRISDAVVFLTRDLLSYLDSASCGCVYNVDWSSIDQLMSIVTSLLSSRGAVCEMDPHILKHTASLLIQAFLHVLPTSSESFHSLKDHILIRTILTLSEAPPSLHKGLLIEEQHGYPFDEGTVDTLDMQLVPNNEGALPTAVFCVSLNGDQEDGYYEHLNLILDPSSKQKSESCDQEDILPFEKHLKFISAKTLKKEGKLKVLLELGSVLVEQGVKVVICQKLVHPDLRRYMMRKGVLVLERLGSALIGSIADLAGTQTVSSTVLPLNNLQWVGTLSNISKVKIANKKFLFLEGPVPYATVVFNCMSELIADEMKPLVASSIKGLEELLHAPRVVSGGGCAETVLANYITQWKDKKLDSTLRQINSDTKSFVGVTKLFSRALLQTASALTNSPNHLLLTDSVSHHCWSIPQDADHTYFTQACTCRCGTVRLSQLDHTAKWSAVRTWIHTEGVIPDQIEQLLSERCPSTVGLNQRTKFPVVCDIMHPKIASYELAGDLTGIFVKTFATLT